jgi:hypothetical protein
MTHSEGNTLLPSLIHIYKSMEGGESFAITSISNKG